MDPAKIFASVIRYVWKEIFVKVIVSKIFHSFPIQLLILNIRKNLIVLAMWVILCLIVLQKMGTMMGMPYLFLEPEYMDQVNFWSTFFLGLTLGGFTMSFHITCYILDGHRFHFLGGVSKPFRKFAINNSVIPLAFLLIYLFKFYTFQKENALVSSDEVWSMIGGILAGYFLIISGFSIYFYITNIDVFKLLSNSLNDTLKRTLISRVNMMERYKSSKRSLRVDYFLGDFLIPQKVQDTHHLDRKTILQVFDQNHFNSVLIQLTVFFLVLVLGTFRDNIYFQIPAGASLVLLLTIINMFIGAMNFWLRKWSFTALIGIIIVIEVMVSFGVFDFDYQAFGLNYHTQKAVYNLSTIQKQSNDKNYMDDVHSTRLILDNWRAKFPKEKKPKMVVICTSGGGHRACVWTMRTLQHVDSTLGGQLMDHSILMTGASGGMVGAAYYRELYLRKIQGEPIDIHAPAYLDNIARDHLNGITFSWILNDIFFLSKEFEYKGLTHTKRRGHAFEEQLNKNTGGIMDKALCEYKEPEMLGQIPMMFLTPTIINDGRKLFISSQNISYMNVPSLFQTRFLDQKVKGVEFLRFFEKQGSPNLRFLSALRMSATFPYVTPNVKLPSKPVMEIMDAGLNDNFGVSTAVRFLFVFRKWIQENTSGVVIVSIRDTQKEKPITKGSQSSFIQRFLSPLQGIYLNQEYFQDMHNDDLAEFAQSWFGDKVKIHRVDFKYVPISKSLKEIKDKEKGIVKIDPNRIITIERAALSWHLTQKEKAGIIRTIHELRNQSAIRRLDRLLQMKD